MMASTLAAVLLLMWTYSLNRGERSLVLAALAFLCVSLSNLLFAGRATLPPNVVMAGSGTLLTLGASLTWAAARAFNGRPIGPVALLAGAGLWLTACQIPQFRESFEIRLAVASAIQVAYFTAAAWEFFVRDHLRTRYALSAALAIHAVIVGLRAPMVVLSTNGGADVFAGTWFGPIALEGVILIQIVAFLMVSLAKERVEANLRLAALTDPLTGLGNRRAFFEGSQPSITEDARQGLTSAAIVFDLDRFKQLNDSHGHPVGDAVLQVFASTAKRHLRPGDFAGRLGGEEFAIALPNTSLENAHRVAERIASAFREAVATMSGDSLDCSTSAGVSASDTPSRSLDQLLVEADRALYEAKRLGGGQVCLSRMSAATDKAA